MSSIFKNTEFKKYFTNTSWMMAEKVIRIFVVLFVGVCVARYLEPDRFGLLSYAHSFVGLFASLSSMGLDGILVRELVKTPKKQYELMGTVFILKIIGASLVFGIIAIAVKFTNNDGLTNTLVFIIATGIFFQSFNVIDLYFQSLVQSKYSVLILFFQSLISSVFKLMFIIIAAPLIWFAVVSLIDSVVFASGLLVMYLYRRQKIGKWNPNKKIGKDLLSDSWPLIFSGFVIAIYMKIDQVMIKEILDAEAVGNYAVAVRLSEACYFIPIVICNSIFPAIINAKQKSESIYHKRLQQLYILMTWIAISIALPISLFSNVIINFLFGEKYIQASQVLAIHMWSGVFVFLGVASVKHLLIENLTKISFMRTFLGAAINVILNIVLIPSFGINGAAFATLISYITSNFSLIIFSKGREIGFMMINSFSPIILLKNWTGK